MNRQESPYQAHLFVCVNDRKGARPSCADGVDTRIKDALKAGVAARGWSGRVRVSQSGCMGLCARGPNVMLYPHGVWFEGVAAGDVESILDETAQRLL